MQPQNLTPALLRGWPLPPAEVDCDKDDRGRVMIVGGSMEIPGAALLAATAALRAGAGKVTVATDERIAVALALAVPELRVLALPCTPGGGLRAEGVEQVLPLAQRAQAILVGPGLQDSASTVDFVRALVAGLEGSATVVLDALAMDALATLERAPAASLVLTPHAGEMAHLTGLQRAHVEENSAALAVEWAARWNGVLALKGATTVIASPNGSLFSHEGGNPGLAVSGSGDCLAGAIAALLARGAHPQQAACWGVWLHAQAGQRLAERQGSIGFLARELSAEFPALLTAMA